MVMMLTTAVLCGHSGSPADVVLVLLVAKMSPEN
jgi:hypothetical protein